MRHADDDLRLLTEGGTLVDLADEMLDHLLRGLEVGDDAFAHRADRLDRTGSPAQHQLGILAHCQNLFLAVLDVIGHDRRFVEDYPLALHIDERVRRPKVNCHVRRKKPAQKSRHFLLPLPTSRPARDSRRAQTGVLILIGNGV